MSVLGRVEGALLLPLLLFVGLFALLPAALLLSGGIVGPHGFGELGLRLADPVDRRAITNSLSEGAASALAALAIGYPVGLFLGRYRFPGRSLLLSTLILPFLLPTVVVAEGVGELFGRGGSLAMLLPASGVLGHGFGGIVLLNVIFNAPVVVLFTIVGLRSASADLDETVQALGGGSWTAYRSVTAGPSLMGAAAGSLLTFLFSALAFAGPILIGGPAWYTVEARVYVLDQELGEPTAAAALALLGVALLSLPTLLYLLLAPRLRAPAGARRPIAPGPLRVGFLPVAGALLSAVAAAVPALLLFSVLERSLVPSSPGQPIGAPMLALFGPSVAARLGVSTATATANTLLYALLVAGLALLLGLSAEFALERLPGARRGIGAVAFLPLLVSPIVLAFALTHLWLGPLGGIGSVGLLIVISQTMLALPFTLQALAAAVGGRPSGLGESARSLGASPWQAFLDVELPTVRAGVAAGALFAFAFGLGEFTATNFLASPSTTTLTVEFYRLGEDRLGGLAPALAGLLALLSLAAFAAILLVGGRRAELL